MELLDDWITSYEPKSEEELYHAKREIMQEIALAGLWRGGFFEKAAFYGGTALRILYGLDRFSEDLDFSLLSKNINFSLEPYLPKIVEEFELLGLKVNLKIKKKKNPNPVESAFLKDNSEWTFLSIESFRPTKIFPDIKIKIEVDRDPPLGFKCESKLLIKPFSFFANTMQKEYLFAGKMHAALFRKWRNNEKGRDWYDLVWYATHAVALNIDHLRIRSVESGSWPKDKPMAKEDIFLLYKNRVERLNLEMAKIDILRFVKNSRNIEIWSNNFFMQLFDHFKFC